MYGGLIDFGGDAGLGVINEGNLTSAEIYLSVPQDNHLLSVFS